MKRNDTQANLERHARIKYELNVRNLSFAELARQAGVDTSAVSRVSSGKSRSVRIEQMLAETLGTEAALLFPERYRAQQVV